MYHTLIRAQSCTIIYLVIKQLFCTDSGDEIFVNGGRGKMSTTESENYQAYLFHQGTNYTSYRYLGAHTSFEDGVHKCTFRVWAPNAKNVGLMCDLTGWDTARPMERSDMEGVWKLTLTSGSGFAGVRYKYAVTGRDGKTYLKADPYAVMSETLGRTASIVSDQLRYSWNDIEWIRQREATVSFRNGHFCPSPINIYEMHLGSWRTHDGKSTAGGDNYISYREAADQLAPYLSDMGYTHVELMPVMEHPYDGSWGYQITGYYAPSARFGTPQDFAYFVDRMHAEGIGVILDWVPAHFPKDRAGLYEFDGEPLYEYQGADRMEHRGWGTRCFDVGRCEVQSFLISNALYWMREYHADGLRIDAVASMLYLDYDKNPGEWIPNSEGNNRNLEAISFFQKLNCAVFSEYPGALMIAEESTAWPMITRPVSEGGLGFNFKWNMGWANDMFEYLSSDPIYRQYRHSALTFPLTYAFSENYVLPISHDEIVHGKRSLIDKMFGSYDSKFSTMRAFLVNMMTMPGKKLMFMGCEFAQFREWDYSNQLEWFMLKYPRHAEMHRFIRSLNKLYLESPELYEIDDSWDGFEWIYPNSADMNMVAYIRRSIGGEEMISVVNYSPVKCDGFVLEVPSGGEYRVLINSDLPELGGTGTLSEKSFASSVRPEDGRDVIRMTLPALSGIILKKDRIPCQTAAAEMNRNEMMKER